MMDIGEEKRFIYEMMRTIVEERRTLTDIYFSLKKKLDDLEELERRGLNELSLKGYVDLHNEQNLALTLENTKRELAHITEKLHKQKNEDGTESKNTVIPPHVIAEQKFRDNNKIIKNKPAASESRNKRTSKRPERKKRIQEMILDEMKNNKNTAYNAGEMFDILLRSQEFRDFNCELNEFRSNMFFRLVTTTPGIAKIGTGKYAFT